MKAAFCTFVVLASARGTLSVNPNEQPCRSLGGTCKSSVQCPSTPLTGKCPSQAANIKCCLAYDEEPCTSIPGSCMLKSSCPTTPLSSKCPTQGADIKCCKHQSVGSDCYTVSRSGWSARAPKNSGTNMSPNRGYVFVHHTAGSECSSRSGCSSAVRGIQNYHMNTKGWRDIGYSYLIGGNGDIFEARAHKTGAHTQGYNSQGYGIAFMGNFMTKQPTNQAINAFHSLVQCLKSNGKISSNYKLKGHRQMGSTSCPGDQLYALVRTWNNYDA